MTIHAQILATGFSRFILLLPSVSIEGFRAERLKWVLRSPMAITSALIIDHDAIPDPDPDCVRPVCGDLSLRGRSARAPAMDTIPSPWDAGSTEALRRRAGL